MRRVDIKTGFLCNNNCKFCVQAGSKCEGNRSFEEIENNLKECRERCDQVVLTGGEVTIRKDFFEIVKLAKDLGYKEIQVPILVNEDSGMGTGQLPDKEGQMYHVSEDNLYLIPTAEVPVTNIFRNTIVKSSELPICLTSYTPCFRREAGSYGAHVRGLNRLHQFDKVEIVRIENPETSYKALTLMVEHVKNILIELELPFRILRLCGGDLGFTSSLTYDFEVYSAAQKKWLEVSSVSNFETFQSNRLKLRIDNNGTKTLAHTLNGSSLALPRIVACILENFQDESSIKIPKALINYTGFEEI